MGRGRLEQEEVGWGGGGKEETLGISNRDETELMAREG